MIATVDAQLGGQETAPAEDLAGAALSLARRFAAGATMWCVAPEWPAHGRHVAVEFVHPVIVGKRALPAVNVAKPNISHEVTAPRAVCPSGTKCLAGLLRQLRRRSGQR